MQSINNTSIFPATCFQEDKREEVKEWVLAVSMDQKVGLNSFPPKSARNRHHHHHHHHHYHCYLRHRACETVFLMDRVVSPLPDH